MPRLLTLALAVLCASALGACGNTLQQRPIPHNLLEGLIVAPFPVYWLGGSFQGMGLTEVTHDPSDAFAVDYGPCAQGGEGACVRVLQVVSSPDNSFLPGGALPRRATRIRGMRAISAENGRTLVIATGGVIVDIFAADASAAAAAARTIVPINQPGTPEAPLPPALPNTGFGQAPLPSQVPPPLRPL